MAFCPRCAAPNIDRAAVCTACGAPLSSLPGVQSPGVIMPQNAAAPSWQSTPSSTMDQTNQRWSGLAIAGFVCSFLCALPGLIMSARAYSACKTSGGQLKGEGLALAGIIISVINMALYFILRVAAN